MGGCSTPTSVLLSEAGALKAFSPINASPADTCITQRQVAAHNSAYDSIKQGKPVSYKAPCDLKKPKKEAATS